MSLTDYGDAFRQCLLEVDTSTMRRLWKHVAPHLPQPETDAAIEIAIHHARTLARVIPMRARAWSHAWLCERGFPSGLPDNLRARAERMYPRVVPGVGISVNFRSPELQPVKVAVQGAMENAVLEVHADGKIADSGLVRARMAEARARVFKELILPPTKGL